MNHYLFDRDNLRQVFNDWRRKELLKSYGYNNVTALCDALIAQKSPWSEYIVGLPGTGKTTFAMQQLWAQKIETKEDIINLLTMDFDKMAFVTCDVEDEIAQNASHITLLQTHPQRVKVQRQQRDEEIEEGESETAFGRKPGTVAKVTTDSSILVSKLKTDYEEKSDIIFYKSNDPTDRETKKHISVSNLSDKRKYVEWWAVAASGKWTPAQIVHIEHQLKRVLSLAQDKSLASFAIIGQNSWWAYDLWLTQSERIKLINLVLKQQLQFITSGTPKFIKDAQRNIVKIIPEKSWAVLWKERLPEWFTEWTYQDLLRQFPDFVKHKDAYAVKAFAWYNFINIGDIPMEWSDESISATFIRRCLVEGNIDLIKPYLSPEIFAVLTSSHNLQALQRRYVLIQKRDQELEDAKNAFMREYRQKHPLTDQPLVNKKWEPVFLTKKHADVCKSRRDQAKIMTYLQNTEQIKKDRERKIKKTYNAQIYAPENRLEI